MSFFKDQWLKFHYNLNPEQTSRENIWDVFTYTSRTNSLDHQSFLQEMKLSCCEINQQALKHNKKLGLFLSGGVDSEIIARTYLELGIDFEPFFILFKNDLNAHEREFVDNFSKQTGKQVNLIDLDIYKWIWDPEGLAKYSTLYRTFDLATTVQLWAREQISADYSIVSGQYEPHMFKAQLGNTLEYKWVHVFEESSFLSRINHCNSNNFFDFPFFYLYRPELYAAYSKDIFVEKMIQNPYKLSLVSTKKQMMEFYFSEMPVRPKYNGFEKLDKTWIGYFNKIIEGFGYQDGEIRILHDNLKDLYNHD